MRNEFYETFYIIHALLIPLTLAFSALHFPPIGWWCWASLTLWIVERVWRLARFVRVNGIIRSTKGRTNLLYIASVNGETPGWKQPPAFESNVQRRRGISPGRFRDESAASETSEQRLISPTDTQGSDIASTRPRPFSIGQDTINSFRTGSSVELMSRTASPDIRTSQYSQHGLVPFSSMTGGHVPSPSQPTMIASSSRRTYMPPPGYAHATLLPGRTIRLRFIPPHHFSWAPGQHVLLSVPSVSKFSSHPFTIASVCDEEASSDEGRELVILVRARNGFTKHLWSHIERLEESGQVGDAPSSNFSSPNRGVLLRTFIDGPFGSSIRARWTSYSTVLVIAGGSGVSFAVAVLEYACMCMAGRSGKQLGGKPGSWGHNAISQIDRVRFVWIVREFCESLRIHDAEVA